MTVSLTEYLSKLIFHFRVCVSEFEAFKCWKILCELQQFERCKGIWRMKIPMMSSLENKNIIKKTWRSKKIVTTIAEELYEKSCTFIANT